MLKKGPPQNQVIDIYETKEDAAGLYVNGPISNRDPTNVFRYPLVYQIAPEGGSFHINAEIQELYPNSYLTEKKCLTELFDYLIRSMESGEEVELYSCWMHGAEHFLESRKKEHDLVIELSTFRLEKEFEWKERQYILVRK